MRRSYLGKWGRCDIIHEILYVCFPFVDSERISTLAIVGTLFVHINGTFTNAARFVSGSNDVVMRSEILTIVL